MAKQLRRMNLGGSSTGFNASTGSRVNPAKPFNTPTPQQLRDAKRAERKANSNWSWDVGDDDDVGPGSAMKRGGVAKKPLKKPTVSRATVSKTTVKRKR